MTLAVAANTALAVGMTCPRWMSQRMLTVVKAVTPLKGKLALMPLLRLFNRNLGLAANFNKISILMADKPLKRMTRRVTR
jgi:hypothetical protein